MAPFLSSVTRSPWFHMFGGPILWIVHFLISYAWVEFACIMKPRVLDSNVLGLTVLSWSILIFTLIVTLAVCYVGWSAHVNWQRLKRSRPKDEMASWEIEARHFMAFSGIALSVLFSLVILLSGLPALVLETCT
jgi:hypothetical protein